jgi:hypothetical protein
MRQLATVIDALGFAVRLNSLNRVDLHVGGGEERGMEPLPHRHDLGETSLCRPCGLALGSSFDGQHDAVRRQLAE